MNSRLPYYTLSAELLSHLVKTKSAIAHSSLSENNKNLVELVYLRISQINGCAYCLDLHSSDLRKNGETTERLDALAGWKVSNLYSSKERSALQWAETLTLIASSRDASDEDYNLLKKEFNDQEISDLTFAISLMNAFNRIAVSMRH